MKGKFVSFVIVVGCLVVVTIVGMHAMRMSNEAWGWEFPVEGLVLQDDGAAAFEQVVTQDRRTLLDLGFPKALRQLHAHVRHLVIHMDCHYFFTTDGRVLVMTLAEDGKAARLVETKVWRGEPHDFRDYRKELLPRT